MPRGKVVSRRKTEEEIEAEEPKKGRTVTVIGGGKPPLKMEIAGKKAGEVKRLLKDTLSLRGDESVLVDGEEVDDECVLEADSVLEFVKETGEKGHIINNQPEEVGCLIFLRNCLKSPLKVSFNSF